MGIDLLTKNRITRFALKSNTLIEDGKLLKQYNTDLGIISSGSRNIPDGSLLNWQLTMPLSVPEVDIVPFMIDWSESKVHPSSYLPDMGCKLKLIYATHPKPKKIIELYKKINCKVQINEAEEVSLNLIIDTPKGTIKL